MIPLAPGPSVVAVPVATLAQVVPLVSFEEETELQELIAVSAANAL